MPSVWPLLRKSVSVYVHYPLPFAALASINVALGLATPRDYLLLELWTLALLLVGNVIGACQTLAAASVSRGYGPRIVDSVRIASRKLKDVLEFTIRHFGAFILLLMTVIGIPWAVRIYVRWFFGLQAIVLDDLTAKEAISESCRLVERRWWSVALVLFLTFAAFAGPVWILSIGWPDSAAYPFVRIALGLTVGPVVAIFWTLLFLGLQEAALAAPDAALPEASAP